MLDDLGQFSLVALSDAFSNSSGVDLGSGMNTASGSFDIVLDPMAINNIGGFIDTFGSATAVPVPAAVWLFGTGLLGLIGVARRKQAA